MITSDDKLAYTVTASIQNALAAALAGKVPLINLRTSPGSSLPHDLRSGYLIPRSISLDFTPLFDVLQLHNYGRPASILMQSSPRSLSLSIPLRIFFPAAARVTALQTIAGRALGFFAQHRKLRPLARHLRLLSRGPVRHRPVAYYHA